MIKLADSGSASWTAEGLTVRLFFDGAAKVNCRWTRASGEEGREASSHHVHVLICAQDLLY